MNAPNELVSTHEASHAVIRDYFGMEIGELWVNEGRGNCRFRVPDCGDIGLLQDIAGSLAGKIAEDRVRGRKGKQERGDYQRAFDCALRLNAQDEVGTKLLLRWMERRTALLVDKLWPQIHKLAFALLEHDRLDGKQIAEVLSLVN
jgi:hypothetical protein